MNPDQVKRTEAITRLAIATQARIDRQTLDVYLEDVAKYPTDVLVEACKRLHKAEFFPKIGELVTQCGEVRSEFRAIAASQEAERYAKLNPPPEWSAERETRQRENFEKFKRDFRAMVAAKSMK